MLRGAHCIRMDLTDRGEDVGANRYSVMAYAPEIPEESRVVNSYGFTAGNPDDTIRGALMNA